MSLELDPAELGFKRPFTAEVSQVLRLRNSNKTAVAFKVKTTAPKQYCVRPNAGRIEPGDSVDVSVVLQPMKQDPPLDVRCKDKFLVQSVQLPAGENPSWAELEKTSKSSIQERKIRCHYLPADGSGPSNATNGDTSHYDDSTMLASSPPAYTPHVASSSGGLDDSTVGDQRSATSQAGDEREEPSHAAAAASRSVPTQQQQAARGGSDDLQSQLASAQATIARLQRQVDESSGLRRRKGDEAKGVTGGAGEAGVSVLQARSEGVPVKWVAILCLIVFLLTYIAF